jgi:uncharacterized DUF497 family protein
MVLSFEGDLDKADQNVRKHEIAFPEAASAFGDPLSVTISDPLHSAQENRHVLIGQSAQGRTLVVVHTEQGDRIRIISARLATRQERKTYEQEEPEQHA